MNLIEQLGGYERAKHEFEMIKEMKPIYSGEIETNDRLLLEYRRAHNIFEIGDKIVSTLNGDEFWMTVVCTIDAFHKKMAITNGAGHTIHHYEFRHATDEEITAGHRL